jgi:ABC-type branched-subunit amino acid transport system substrate-binding protein
MGSMKILAFALLASFVTAVTANAQGADVIKVAVVDDLSGPYADRGKLVTDMYKKYIEDTNAAGGISVGQRKYKIEGRFEDSAGNPKNAAAATEKAISNDAVVVLCPDLGCMGPAERTKTPLILTFGGWSISQKVSSTFLINAPTRDDFEMQAKLAIKTLHTALSKSQQPTPENITDALRKVDITDSLGAVHFDKSGNNAGRVTYPFRKISGINQSCSKSCASTCPKDCGQTACSKDGTDQCCNVCGMPRPPN